MAILKVARMGHPILRQVASKLDPAAIETESFQEFLASLVETMHEYDGAGLAAPQVHVSQRVVAMEVANNPRYPDAPAIPRMIVINPEVRFLTDERIDIVEGCLSIPDLRGVVPRIAAVELSALDPQGHEICLQFEGFAAAVVQHECDHLDGVLYIDRVADSRSLAFTREFERYHSVP
jgi:peptide deformylase